MNYVMSDIHGCYEHFIKMLELIDFTDSDTLIIIGDVLDRGPKPVKLLRDIMKRENVRLLFGNHEYNWIHNVDKITNNAFLISSPAEQEKILNYLNDLPYYITTDKYLFVHTLPKGFNKETPIEKYKKSHLLFHRDIDYGQNFYDDKTIIIGHTPTLFIDKEFAGKIYKREGIINIDCGCIYSKRGGRLGCLRLDDMNEYYV